MFYQTGSSQKAKCLRPFAVSSFLLPFPLTHSNASGALLGRYRSVPIPTKGNLAHTPVSSQSAPVPVGETGVSKL